MNRQSVFADTIFALSSGMPPSGVAVIRLSGPHVRAVLEAMTGSVPEPRRLVLRAIAGEPGRVLDKGLVAYLERPGSFTGEDCAELHVHGGKAVVNAVLSALAGMAGLRMAEAGEFTRRAFVNGRLDLTTAEALADLVAAETESQRRMALDNADGRQRDLYAGWRRRLVRARAMMEAALDFSDEADVPGLVPEAVWRDIEALEAEILGHLDGYRAAEIVREGFRVVLLGAPNAGKSSLLNALARREAAIVTDVPGTTRDLIEVALDLDGIKVLLTDTAGIRDTSDVVERIGVDRAFHAARTADLVLCLVDPTQTNVERPMAPDGVDALFVATKSDVARPDGAFDHVVSAHGGEGLAGLVRGISGRAAQAVHGAGSVVPARLRHKTLLEDCCAALARARTALALELAAEELRFAGTMLGRITGQVDVEDLLDVIFSEFCIGK